MANRKNKRSEVFTGLYAAIPHAVIKCARYTVTSHLARALLVEVAMDHNGNNNGHLHVHQKSLKDRGWCVASILRARDELLHNGLLIQTRHGGLNNGSHLYAVTWLSITNYIGLQIEPHQYRPGLYLMPVPEAPFEVPKKRAIAASPADPQKKNPCLPRREANGPATLPRRQGGGVALSAAQSEGACFQGSALSAAQRHIKKAIGYGQIAPASKPSKPRAAQIARIH